MSDLETVTRQTYAASVQRLDSRLQSRLTQARHAALDELAVQRSASGMAQWRRWLRPATFAPVGAVAAAAVVAVVLLLGRNPAGFVSGVEPGGAIEDMELLADNDAMELGTDNDYDFYEWAAAQDANADAGTQGS